MLPKSDANQGISSLDDLAVDEHRASFYYLK